MTEQILGVTKIVNLLFGKIALALLTALHIHVENPEYPIPNHVAMELLVFAVVAAFFLWLKARLSVENPGGTQQCMEALITNSMGVGVNDLIDDLIGHGGEKYLPMLGSIGIFVMACNLISVIPGLSSPTATSSVPLGCAIIVFLYYNWAGIRQHGVVGHGKHFLGPVWWLAWLMLPIEIVSNLSRLLSLTVRLWVNMLVSEILYGLFLGLTVALFVGLGKLSPIGYASGVVPFLAPPIFILLHVFVAVLQAFVFTILPVMYVSAVVAVADH
jgi:F-type H+-transporting ATPase subunit a